VKTNKEDPKPAEDEVNTGPPDIDAPEDKVKPDIVGEDGVIRLSLDREEFPVDLGDGKKYVLRELSGTQRDKYLNNLGGRVRTNADGKVTGMKNFDGLQANLLIRCLFEVQAEGKEVALKEAEIQKFPAKVQTALFNKAKTMSGMDDDAEDTAGND